MSKRDYVALSKRIYCNLDIISDLIRVVEADSAWIRDHIFDSWVDSRDVRHLFESDLKLNDGRFVRQRILDAFCSARDRENADSRLNLVLLDLCVEGVEIC